MLRTRIERLEQRKQHRGGPVQGNAALEMIAAFIVAHCITRQIKPTDKLWHDLSWIRFNEQGDIAGAADDHTCFDISTDKEARECAVRVLCLAWAPAARKHRAEIDTLMRRICEIVNARRDELRPIFAACAIPETADEDAARLALVAWSC